MMSHLAASVAFILAALASSSTANAAPGQLRDGDTDAPEHRLEVREDLGVADAQHPPAQPDELSLLARVRALRGWLGVVAAIDLHDETSGRAGEVRDEAAQHELPPEATTEAPAAQVLPEERLRRGGLGTHGAGPLGEQDDASTRDGNARRHEQTLRSRGEVPGDEPPRAGSVTGEASTALSNFGDSRAEPGAERARPRGAGHLAPVRELASLEREDDLEPSIDDLDAAMETGSPTRAQRSEAARARVRGERWRAAERAQRAPMASLHLLALDLPAARSEASTTEGATNAGEQQKKVLEMVVDKDAPPPVVEGRPMWPTITLAILGAAGVGVGVGLTVVSTNKYADAETASGCDPATTTCRDEVTDLLGSSDALQNGGVAAFAVGGAALVAMGVYLAVPFGSATVTATPTTSGLMIRGAF